MKNYTLRAPWVLFVFFCMFDSIGSAQTFALANKHISSQTKTSTGLHMPKRLKDVLNELSRQYNINILFEEKVIQSIVLETDPGFNRFRKPEKELEQLLKPLGLDFKKIGKSQYVVFSVKPELSSSESLSSKGNKIEALRSIGKEDLTGPSTSRLYGSSVKIPPVSNEQRVTGTVTEEYDPQLLAAETEFITLTDKRLSNVWGSEEFRLRLKALKT